MFPRPPSRSDGVNQVLLPLRHIHTEYADRSWEVVCSTCQSLHPRLLYGHTVFIFLQCPSTNPHPRQKRFTHLCGVRRSLPGRARVPYRRAGVLWISRCPAADGRQELYPKCTSEPLDAENSACWSQFFGPTSVKSS